MDQKLRTQIEERLLQERARALRALAQFDEVAKVSPLADDGDLTNYPFHLADEGTDTMEQEKEFLLASKEGRRVYWIDAALRRLYREPARFGVCMGCGREISVERLEIVPWTQYCVDCQRAEEDGLGAAA